MSLRDLILDTFAVAADPAQLGRRWRGVRMPAAAFARLMSVEDCAGDLLVRWRELGIEDAVPTATLDDVTRRTHEQMARMLAVRAQLGELVEAYRDAGIEVTLLKGAAFLATGLRQLRPFTDLDLLVRTADIERARAVMQSLAYASDTELAIEDHHHLPPFTRRGAVAVELHVRTLNRGLALSAGDVPSIEVEPGTHVLTPTEWCWHALAHEARHHDLAGRVRGALDVVALASHHTDIDWLAIAQRSRAATDHIGVVARSVLRIRPDLPMHVSAGSRLRAACATYGRERAARGAASEKAFAAALYRIGMLALGADRWEHRLDPPRARGAAARLVPRPVFHLATVVAITMGRDVN
jgi:hypothetical protein